MNRTKAAPQTYIPAPWRRQWQIVGVVGAIGVFVALVIGLYMSVTAKTASVGRQIQSMEDLIGEADRKIEDLSSELGALTSAQQMEARAKALGYRQYDVEEVMYLKIPGYVEDRPVEIASSQRDEVVPAKSLPPEYTESLLDWLFRKLQELFSGVFGVAS